MVPDISRTTAIPLFIGVLCIVTIGIGAATLNTANPIGATDSQIVDPPSPGEDILPDDAESDVDDSDPNAASGGFTSISQCVEPLDTTLGTLLVVAGLVVMTVLVYLRYNLAISLFIGWTVMPPVALVYFMLTDCGGGGLGYGSGDTIGGLNSAGETILPATKLPPWLMAVLIGGVLLAAVAMLYSSVGEDETVALQEEEDSNDPNLNEFAAAAGRAADRIENRNANVDNAVYEAWLEMIGLFDVERAETYAPEEFADEAIDLGMDTADVTEITQLFNEVRYGDRDATTREDRALEVLRNIETAYGTSAHDQTDNSRGEKE